jgi:hypothetical protein
MRRSAEMLRWTMPLTQNQLGEHVRNMATLTSRTKTTVKLLGLLAGILAVALVSSSAGAQAPDRHAERPAGQPASSVSFMERSISLTQPGTLEFAYFVDSQPGHDFFRVRIDGTVAFEASGDAGAGRPRLALAAGNHVVRFSYEKDAAQDNGQDTAWVDDVRVRSGGKLVGSWRFDEASLSTPTGWQSGGFGGGFVVARHAPRRALRRSVEAAFPGYNPNGLTASAERQIVWPAGGANNTFTIFFFVDSEDGHDFFKVSVDGVEKFSISGRERFGRQEIDVGGPGAHTVRFDYVKDQSVDEGLDDARVMHFEARSNGVAFELGGFDGHEVGADVSGWAKPAGVDIGWVSGAGIEAELFAFPTSVNAEPVVDGLREAAYKRGTKVSFRESGNLTGQTGRVETLVDATHRALFLRFRAPARSAALGGERGDVTLFLDTDRARTSSGFGCDADGALPGPEDRRLRIEYQPNPGSAAANVSVEQDIGTCNESTPWRAVADSERLAASAAIVEVANDEGFVQFEARIALESTSALTDGVFGLGLRAEPRDNLKYELPGIDSFPLLDADTSSWETVVLGSISPRARLPAHVVLDGTPNQ